MPPQSSETTLLTVLGDVHYFFSPPEHQPLHHRFDKGSYVYLYENTSDHTGRVELANNPGTSNQDAVAGELEGAHISYSFKKPNVFTFKPRITPWQLPAFDPRNERKYLYPLHSVEVYFWTTEGASQCLQSLRQIRGLGALDIRDAAPEEKSEHDDPTHPVIERLENAVISTPGQKQQDNATAIASPQPQSAASASAARTDSSTPGVQASGEAAAAFAPVPYNPAAPAAPEVRTHREKTPPPADAQPGNGVAEMGMSQYGGQSSTYGQFGQSKPTSAFGGPPQQGQTHSLSSSAGPSQSYQPGRPGQHTSPSPQQQVSGFPPPPPSGPPGSVAHGPGHQAASQVPLPFSPPPTQSSFNAPHGGYQAQQQFHGQPPVSPGMSSGFPPPPPSQQTGFGPSQSQQTGFGAPPHGGYQSSPPQQQSYPPPPPSQSPPQGYQPPHQGWSPQAQGSQQQKPPGGGFPTWGQSQVPGQSQAPGQSQQGYDPNAVQSQFNKPTNAEAAQASKPAIGNASGWGLKADKAEKSVNRFLKRLDKKF